MRFYKCVTLDTGQEGCGGAFPGVTQFFWGYILPL